MKRLVVLALLCLSAIFPRGARGQSCTMATCTAASAGESDVQAALPSNANANSTVTVIIPSGTASWSTGINYTIPSGVTSLIIEGNTSVACSGTAGQSSYACAATDNTLIQDGVTGNTSILKITSAAGQSVRVTGITLQGSASGANNKYSGDLNISGGSTSVRLDHDHFEVNPSNNNSELVEFDGAGGVVDHSLFDLGNNSSVANGVRVFAFSSGYGDSSWNNTPTAWGSGQGVYLEDNVFNGSAPNDCDDSGQYVMRYNTINDAFLGAQNHSTSGGSAGWRGCRRMEVYKNYFTGPSSGADAAISIKGGPALVWGNTEASGYFRFLIAQTDRNTTNYAETATPNGWGYCFWGASPQAASPWDGNSSGATGYPCLDGVGRGETLQNMNGLFFPNRLNLSTGTIAWPQQLLEPVYGWMDSIGSATMLNIRDNSAQQNRDVYVDNSGCSGSGCSTLATGTGWGTLAQRPSTCTAGPGGTFGASPTGSYGVAYWATDQNQLYVCTSTNTWTAVYTPYTYPHPLVSGGSTLNPPAISPGNGSYSSPQTVTLTPPSGSIACYRTDGNAPTATAAGTCDVGSTAYSGPFSLTIPGAGAVVQAISTESGQLNSSVASASYALQTCRGTPLGGNWTCVSDATNFTSSSGTSLTAGPFSVNPPAGSLVLVFQLDGSNAACAAPTDTLASSFTAISTATVAADSMQLCDWYGVVGGAGADSVTCNAAASASLMGCSVVNVTGQSTGALVDQTCTRSNALSASGINNMTCANSITVAAPNELVVAAAFGDLGVRSAGTNFTIIDPNDWSGEYFMETTPMIWTPSETMSAGGLNYGFLAVTMEPLNLVQTPGSPTALTTEVR